MNRNLLLFMLLLFGCASVPPRLPADVPVIVLEEEPDGAHWRATWHLAEPAREILFERRSSGFRPRVFEVLTSGFTFDKRGEQEVLRTDGEPVRSISVRFPEYSEWLEKDYEFFQTFSDGSVAVYTGHLVARVISGDTPEECDDCFIRSFRFVADSPIVIDGRVEQSPVDWKDEHEQGAYVYFGSLEPLETPEMISIVDPALPEWLESETKQALPKLFELYTERFGVSLPERPTILFSYDNTGQSGYFSGGGTLPGQIQLTLDGDSWEEPSDDAMLHLFKFLAHEAAHLWNGQIVRYPGSEDSWMHEGSADALAQRALLELGLIDEERFLEYQTAALNECRRGLDGSALRDAEKRRAFQLYYACGNMLALVTEQVTPDTDLFDFWRELIEHALVESGRYDADDYVTVWRSLGGDPGAIERLRRFVESESTADQLAGMLRRSGVTLVESSDPPQTYGQAVSRDAFFLLMRESCKGSYGFNMSSDGFALSDGLDCGPLPGGGFVRFVGGRDVLREGELVWDAMLELCGNEQPVEVQVKAGGEESSISLPCTATMAPRPAYLRVVDLGRSRTEGDLEAIAAQSRRLSEAYVSGDIEALVDVYATDGIAIPGGRDAIRGRDDLLKLWSLPEGRTILRHKAEPVDIEIDGDLAYDWGYYEGQGAQNGAPLDPFRGIYTIVWTRGDDGIWRIAVDMWHGLRSD